MQVDDRRGIGRGRSTRAQPTLLKMLLSPQSINSKMIETRRDGHSVRLIDLMMQQPQTSSSEHSGSNIFSAPPSPPILHSTTKHNHSCENGPVSNLLSFAQSLLLLLLLESVTIVEQNIRESSFASLVFLFSFGGQIRRQHSSTAAQRSAQRSMQPRDQCIK
jgi:hypothetical protein